MEWIDRCGQVNRGNRWTDMNRWTDRTDGQTGTGGQMEQVDRWTDRTDGQMEQVDGWTDRTDGQMEQVRQVDRWDRWNRWTDGNRWTGGTGRQVGQVDRCEWVDIPHFVLLLCTISGLLQAILVSKSLFYLPGVLKYVFSLYLRFLDLNFHFFAHFCPLFWPIFVSFW